MGWQVGGGLPKAAKRLRLDATGNRDCRGGPDSVMDAVALEEDDSLR